eukprot:COSAG01_NODE_129_length_24935_cov_39.324368_14_plen_116_part_00
MVVLLLLLLLLLLLFFSLFFLLLACGSELSLLSTSAHWLPLRATDWAGWPGTGRPWWEARTPVWLYTARSRCGSPCLARVSHSNQRQQQQYQAQGMGCGSRWLPPRSRRREEVIM